MPPIPMAAVGSMKNASSVQKTRSQGQTIRCPPPMHPPCTAAIVGFMTDAMRRISSGADSRTVPGAARSGSFRLAPTQKCFPFARITTTRDSSVLARCHACWNSAWNASSYALTGTRSSVITPTSPSSE